MARSRDWNAGVSGCVEAAQGEAEAGQWPQVLAFTVAQMVTEYTVGSLEQYCTV